MEDNWRSQKHWGHGRDPRGSVGERAMGSKTSLMGMGWGENTVSSGRNRTQSQLLCHCKFRCLYYGACSQKTLETQLPVHMHRDSGAWEHGCMCVTLTASSEPEAVPLPPSHQSISWGAPSYLRFDIQAKDVVARGQWAAHSVPHSH